jgi:hypothetical protein
MSFTEKDVLDFSGGQIAEKHVALCITALDELCAWFGRAWLDSEIVLQTFTDPIAIAEMGSVRQYHGITALELLVSFWGDLTLLKNLQGFDALLAKVKKGRRHDNVDVEVSVAAELLRQGAIVELEPIVNGGPKAADCRFKAGGAANWVYCEITRRLPAKVSALIDSRGKELARAAAEQDHMQRCVVVVTRAVDEHEHLEILAWLSSRPASPRHKDCGVFFKVPHHSDDTSLALQHVSGPVSVRQSGDVRTGAFGVAYLHYPDLGANSKLSDKADQMPENESGVLIIDLGAVAGGLTDWQKQIADFPDLSKLERFSAFVLMTEFPSADGYQRDAIVIPNAKAKSPISSETLAFLTKLSRVRSGGSLMD